MKRGYFEIGIYRGKNKDNLGTLWRSAYQLGASGIFTIGVRFPKQATDTVKSWMHVPIRQYGDFDEFMRYKPIESAVVAVEMGGKPLSKFWHPERAIYLMGAEDHGIPPEIVAQCNACVSLESVRTASYNVAVAGSLVMYHRTMQ